MNFCPSLDQPLPWLYSYFCLILLSILSTHSSTTTTTSGEKKTYTQRKEIQTRYPLSKALTQQQSIIQYIRITQHSEACHRASPWEIPGIFHLTCLVFIWKRDRKLMAQYHSPAFKGTSALQSLCANLAACEVILIGDCLPQTRNLEHKEIRSQNRAEIQVTLQAQGTLLCFILFLI